MFSPIRAILLLTLGTVTVAGMTASAAVGQSRSIVEVMDTVSIGVAAGAPAVGDRDTVAQAGSGESHDATVGAVLSTRSIGPDVIVGDLQSVLRFGRIGDITAYSVGTTPCNMGNERVSWIASINAHPVYVQGMYRLAEGRFEQIGMSWAVHGFYALSQTFCWPGTGNVCGDPTNGSQLGVHCSTENSHYLNGVQLNMSLRSDIDAHSGDFPYPWVGPVWDDLTYKRIQVHDADLDPDLNPGALFFIEAHYIAADEAAAGNGNNSASYRRAAVYEQSPNVFAVTPTDETQREQPAIRAWKDTDLSAHETDIQVPGEGLFILAAKATELSGGLWHYEYALQNLNSDRSAGSFSVPLGPGTVVENVGFHDVDYHSGEIYDSTDWQATVADGAITWSTEAYDVNPHANALRFSTLYNFRFDADVPPRSATVTVGLFKPGIPEEVTGLSIAPDVVGPDVIVGDLQSLRRWGRVGDITAYSVGTIACNIGDERVSWIASINAHPVWVQGMYRLKEGRFEQIGMSWAVHGFYAVSQTFCWPGTGDICGDPTDGSQLGVHCSNPNSHYTNGVQLNMSLRSDIDAHSGYFPYPWEGPDWEDLTDKRIQVHDADLDPDLNPGALFFIEAQYIAADEAAAGNGNNSASYRRVAVFEQSPNIFRVTLTSVTQREQTAIRAWQDTDLSVHETDIQVPGEGLFILAAKATELSGGLWHYEYALQNLNSDRSAGSFGVPLPLGAVVENVGFHDVDYHSGEVYDSTDWVPVVENSAIRWSTETYDNNPDANALRFATIYNFRFDANVGPWDTIATIGMFKPGTPGIVTGETIGPSIDCNNNGISDVCDFECGGECDQPCGFSADCNGNNMPDECEPDCNANGIADECDIKDGPSNDCNENVIPDECEPDCDGDGIPDDCDTFEDADGDGVHDCYDRCPESTPVGACVCPAMGDCCLPAGLCFGGYPRVSCLELGGTPDCIETLCRDGCLIGDRDSDGDRDLRDCAALQRCYSGPYEDPGYESLSGDCALHFDFDEDNDVDLDDFRMFQENQGGP